MNQSLLDLLYKIPPNVDYACDLGELDECDIPRDRVPKLKELLHGQDEFIAFEAARVLCSWADEDGFEFIRSFVCDRAPLEINWTPHRLHGYDDTYRLAMLALQAYWARKATIGPEAGEKARVKIFSPMSMIIELSSKLPFAIDYFFYMVEKLKFTEYIPLLKNHFKAILRSPQIHGWKVADCAHLLMKFDSEFVELALAEHGKSLSDFPITH